jgi:hypothetical protein
LLTPTLSNHVLVGPSAVDVTERDARAAQCDSDTAQNLLAFAREKLKLNGERVVTTYAGLRPATQFQDYVIQAHAEKQWVTVAGIRSTGVSASLGIAEYTVQQLERILAPLHVSFPQLHSRLLPPPLPLFLLPHTQSRSENLSRILHLPHLRAATTRHCPRPSTPSPGSCAPPPSCL